MGFTLGKFFAEKGNEITGYYSRNTNSATEAAKFTHTKAYNSLEALVNDSDVLFLTVPDSSIRSVYQQISAFPLRDKYICHCSGAKTSAEVFPDIDKQGAYEFSVHPLFAVSDKYNAYKELSDVFFTIEGNKQKLPEMMKMLKSTGINIQSIDGKHKTKYHASAVMASNLVIGLIWESLQLLQECGFSQEDALRALSPLIKGNLEHILEYGPKAALTGPVERDDMETIAEHLKCITNSNTKSSYCTLSKSLVEIAKEKHPDRDYQDLLSLLNITGDYF